jgi:hypothetical protein
VGQRFWGIRLSTLEAAADALLRVNNIRVRHPDQTDEEIRKANEREWSEKDEVVLQQWREFMRVFKNIEESRLIFPGDQTDRTIGTWVDVRE